MKKALALVLACIMLLSLGACSNDKDTSRETSFDFKSYPMETDQTLTYWVKLPHNNVSIVTSLNETPFAKELEKKTGVKVEYIHPSAGQEEQAFGLMLASNELPDIIEYTWATVAGGPSKAILEETILPLNDYMKDAPNLKKYLDEHPDYDRAARTDEGDYYMFPFIRDDYSLLISAGPIIRKDWLDDLGLDAPETIEDWTNMLTAFKEKKGATAPFTIQGSYSLVGMFGARNYFYVDNGKVKFGPAEPEYKAALQGIASWFKKGLLDPNYMSLDKKTLTANILTGKSGATYGGGGGDLGQWISAKPNDKFDLMGVMYPLTKKGVPNTAIPASTPFQTTGAAITTACKNPALAARFLDYNYTEEGHMLCNFGIEGVSYKMDGDNLVYTDEIYKNANGYTTSQAMGLYFRAASSGPFIQDKRYIEGYYNTPQQQQALKSWMTGLDLALARDIGITFPTVDESSESAAIITEIDKYVQEMAVRFITGIESFDNYDAFLKRLDELNVKRAIELQQASYDRMRNK